MKKITKALVAILLVAVLSMTGITVFASNDIITPRLSHANSADFLFSATANGGYIDVSYLGYDSFVKADLTVKVERRYLWIIWTEIGTWSATNYESDGDFVHTFDLTGSATYRATFTLKITGNDGTVDTIEQVIESKY